MTSFFTVSVNERGFNLLEAGVLYNVRRYSVGMADRSLCRSGILGSWVPSRNGLALMKTEVRLLIGEETWSRPEGGFDARIMAEPGLFSNVENGFGMAVGGYNHERSVYPSPEAVEGTQFFDFLQRAPTTCSDYCACGWQ